jgi:hypothetical protein
LRRYDADTDAISNANACTDSNPDAHALPAGLQRVVPGNYLDIPDWMSV